MTRPLRILHIYPKHDYFTGAAIQLHELATGLRARGHEVVLSTQPSAAWEQKCREVAIPYYPLPMHSQVDLRSVLGVITILRRHRVQVVHAHKGKARTLALLAGLFARVPILILNRGVSFPLDPLNRLGYTTRRVTAVIVVCDALKQELVAQGVPAKKIHVIYSATDTERFHPSVNGAAVRRDLGFTPDDFVVAQIGVRSWKGNGDVIQAMGEVVARAPHARLLVVGARDAAPLMETAAAVGLQHRLSVLGYREDVPEILAASDCCVDASYAGLGLTGTLREALAMGKPVIATAIEGNPELVVDGETGILIPPRNPRALAEAIRRLIDDPSAARRMGCEGQRRVAERFSLSAKLDATEALYRQLVSRRC